jgi:glyceraldehyde 3-phosphate dehydrogenase
MEGIKGPQVSSMILGSSVPSIFDANQTQVIGNLAKLFSWYDNVAGYSHQAVKLARMIGK